MMTCCTSSGPTSARSSAAVMAVAPSSVASSVDRPPPILPMGVRAAPRITVLGIEAILLRLRCGQIEAGGSQSYRAAVQAHVTMSTRGVTGAWRPRFGAARYRARIVNVSWTNEPPAQTGADTVAIGVFEGDEAPAGTPAEVAELLASGE